MEEIKERLSRLEKSHETIERNQKANDGQIRKLFSLLTRQGEETNSKLAEIIEQLKAQVQTDQTHGTALEDAAAERAELRKTVSGMVGQDLKNKGLPTNGKDFKMLAGLGGAIGSFLLAITTLLLQHLPEIGDTVIKVWKGVAQ